VDFDVHVDFDAGAEIGSSWSCSFRPTLVPTPVGREEDGGAKALLVVLRAQRNNAVTKKQFDILTICDLLCFTQIKLSEHGVVIVRVRVLQRFRPDC